MTKRLTPAEYYEHAKALFPTLTHIARSNGDIVAVVYPEGRFTLGDNIDWGDVDQWPPPVVEKRWRDAVWPQDYGKPVQYFFTKKCLDFYEGTLVGYHGDDPSFVVFDKDEMELYWASKAQVEDIPEQAQTPPPNYMLEALCSALNVLEKGIEVRIQDSWPALKAMLPETIRKVKDAIERAEADLGAQKQPSSVAKIQAETKAVARELENVGGSVQVPTDPADREPTDEEVERVCELRFNGEDGEQHWHHFTWGSKQALTESAKRWLKAWQQVWREQK